MQLVVENLTKKFTSSSGESTRQVVAVDDLSFTVDEGQFFTLLGPSGCGKTTTLRSIAGLEKPTSGAIRVGDRTLYSDQEGLHVPANNRGLGMVFQSYAIWPHMNVFRNVAFPLQVAPRSDRPSKKEIESRVEEALSVVHMLELRNRPATNLSGGQQQRLALARALVMRPPLLLLDEPLSNLDAKLREEMRFELKRLQRTLGITTLYVTHDQAEALAMSDQIGVMNKGTFEQVGPPRDVYDRPMTHFVADFIGASNFVPATVQREMSRGVYLVDTPGGAAVARASEAFQAGERALIAVRPENVSVNPGLPTSSDPGHWPGTVRAVAFLGEAVDHLVSVADMDIQARCNPRAALEPNANVTVSLSPDETWLVRQDSADAAQVKDEAAVGIGVKG